MAAPLATHVRLPAKRPFEPLFEPQVLRFSPKAPLNDLASVRTPLRSTTKPIAVMMEPIQGRSWRVGLAAGSVFCVTCATLTKEHTAFC